MTRALITGGTGFIGRAVATALGDRGIDTVAAGSTLADLWDERAVERLLDEVRPTHLVHLAWCAEPPHYWTSPANLRWVEATLALARHFSRVGGERFVLGSTCAVYETTDGPCVESSTPTAPSTLYGTAKLATAQLLTAGADALGIAVAECRLFQPYGPTEHPDRLVPSIIRSLLAGKEKRCTDGRQARDFIHVDDVGRALAAVALSNVSGPVNIGTGQATTVATVARTLERLVGASDLLRLGAIPRPPTDPDFVVADVRRLRDEVGFTPVLDVDAGLAATVESLRTLGD